MDYVKIFRNEIERLDYLVDCEGGCEIQGSAAGAMITAEDSSEQPCTTVAAIVGEKKKTSFSGANAINCVQAVMRQNG